MYQKFSLILWWWSARGLAHIGVIRRIEELNVVPDLIVGTSIGALIGAFYASGYSSKEMQKIAEQVGIFSMIDIDLMWWWIKGNKVMAFLRKHFWKKTFKDLAIPLKIIATNLDTGEKVVFKEGSLIEAIRASISIPWVFLPYRYKNNQIVDGWVVANLAVEEALPWKKIIAVSVQMPIKTMKKNKSKKKAFFNIENPFWNTYLILRKTINIMITQNELKSITSRNNVCFFQLAHPEVDYHDFKKSKKLINAGYMMSEPINAFIF